MEKVMNALKVFGQMPPRFIAGMAVHVVPDMPRMQLSVDCPVTDDFRAATNRWLAEFFGLENPLKDDVIYHDHMTKRLFCTPQTWDVLNKGIQTPEDAQNLRTYIAQAVMREQTPAPAPVLAQPAQQPAPHAPEAGLVKKEPVRKLNRRAYKQRKKKSARK